MGSDNASWNHRALDRLWWTSKWAKRLEAYLSRNEDPNRRVSRYEGLLAYQLRKTGSNSIRTTNSRRDLAEALERAGRLEEATVLRRQVLDTCERNFGNRSDEVLHEEL